MRSITIYMDFSKAFEIVSHEILHEKSIQIGLCRSTSVWIENWLDDPKQRPMLNSSVLNCGEVSGVEAKTGSVLHSSD